MDQLDDFLKNIDHSEQAPLPTGFEERVLDKWFNDVPQRKNNKYNIFIYAAAACLIAFTCINILALKVLNSSAEEVSENVSNNVELTSETEFAEAYGLIETTTYYTLNK